MRLGYKTTNSNQTASSTLQAAFPTCMLGTRHQRHPKTLTRSIRSCQWCRLRGKGCSLSLATTTEAPCDLCSRYNVSCSGSGVVKPSWMNEDNPVFLAIKEAHQRWIVCRKNRADDVTPLPNPEDLRLIGEQQLRLGLPLNLNNGATITVHRPPSRYAPTTEPSRATPFVCDPLMNYSHVMSPTRLHRFDTRTQSHPRRPFPPVSNAAPPVIFASTTVSRLYSPPPYPPPHVYYTTPTRLVSSSPGGLCYAPLPYPLPRTRPLGTVMHRYAPPSGSPLQNFRQQEFYPTASVPSLFDRMRVDGLPQQQRTPQAPPKIVITQLKEAPELGYLAAALEDFQSNPEEWELRDTDSVSAGYSSQAPSPYSASSNFPSSPSLSPSTSPSSSYSELDPRSNAVITDFDSLSLAYPTSTNISALPSPSSLFVPVLHQRNG